MTSSGGYGAVTYALSGGTLPTGLSFSTSTGQISGTPTALLSTTTFTVTATDSTTPVAQTSSKTFQLTVAAPALATTQAAASTTLTANSNFGSPFTPVTSSGGFGAVTYSLSGGTLPTGLSFSTSTGQISGTPTAVLATTTFTVTATDQATPVAQTSSKTFQLTVNLAPTITMSAAALSNGKQGVAYSQQVSASGGLAPYTYTIGSGALPGGLSLNSSTGAITGTPTTAGTFNFTVKGVDSSTGAGPFSASGAYSITIATSPPVLGSPIQASTLQGKLLTIDLSLQASNGPFTGGSVVSISPVGAATVTIVPVVKGSATDYVLNFTSVGAFSGQVVVTYSLSNAYESATNTVTVSVQPRPDPSKNPDIVGIVNSEYQSALRLSQSQIDNFNDHLQSLHDGVAPHQNVGGLGFHNGMNFRAGDGNITDPFAAREHDLMQGPAGFNPPPAFGAVTTPLSPNPGAPPALAPASLSRAVGSDAIAHGGGAQTQTLASVGGPTSDKALASDSANPNPSSLDGASDRVTLWTAGAVDFGMHSTPTSHVGLHFQTEGITVGADVQASNALTLGFGLGYGQDVTKFGQTGAYTNSRDYAGAFYGDWRVSKVNYIDLVAGYSNLDFSSRRFDSGANADAYGQRAGHDVFGSFTFGWDLYAADWKLTAYTRMNGMVGSLDRFTETGAGSYDLTFASQTVSAINGVLGLRGSLPLSFRSNLLTPRFTLEYQRDFAGADAGSLAYADWVGGPSYAVSVTDTSRDHLTVGVGSNVLSGPLSLDVDFKSLFTNGQSPEDQVEAKVAVKF